jgi:starch phosphorylase
LLQEVLHLLECDFFCPGDPGLFRPIYEELRRHDEFCLLADFAPYLAAQDAVADAYTDSARWTRMSILNVARAGKFSSDRTIQEYVRDIWHAKSIDVPSQMLAFGQGAWDDSTEE